MNSHRSHLIRLIVTDFAPRHIRRPRVFLPGRELDRQALGELGVSPFAPLTAPDVVIHDLERDWLFLFDAVTSSRHMTEARREQMAGHFTRSGKSVVFFSAFADRNIFSCFAESIPWIADAPDHMIHYNMTEGQALGCAIPTRTALPKGRPEVSRKSPSMMAAPWFSNIRDATRTRLKTTATKRNLGKVTRRRTLATHECDRQNP